MEDMVSVTYTGSQEQLSVHVAGGFKIVLARGVPKLVPAKYAYVFQGDEFVLDDKPAVLSSNDDLLLKE